MNSLYEQYTSAAPNGTADGGFSQMVQEIRRFKQNFKGDPRAEVQRLLQSGEMSQDQFNRYSQMANQITEMMKR